MKNFQKGSTSMWLIIVIVVLVIIVGYFAFIKKSVPSITIVSPNGGEILKIGQEYVIQWDSKNIPKNDQIDIILFKKRGLTKIGQLSNNSFPKSYVWRVSDVLLPDVGSDFKLRIGAYSVQSGGGWESQVIESAKDESDAEFTISK
jgi:hypothetical protein